MTRVVFEVSMSLDGFATASGVCPEKSRGYGGQQLHERAQGSDTRGHEVPVEMRNTVAATCGPVRA